MAMRNDDHRRRRTKRPGEGAPALRLLPCGDSAVTVELGDRIDPAVHRRVMALDGALRAIGPPILETVPAYRSVTILYDARRADFEDVCVLVTKVASRKSMHRLQGRLWEIPVVYGGRFGVDLDSLAERHGLTAGEVVRRHSAARYRVYMIGFVPGFAYLGGLDPALGTPRLDIPRRSTPPGSISIGDRQTAVGSMAAPSGWHLIGRTPVRLFKSDRDPACILEAGDEVTFKPVAEAQWSDLAMAAHRGDTVARLLRRSARAGSGGPVA